MRLLIVFMLAALQLPGATIYLNGPASVYEACLQGATLSDVTEFDNAANGFAQTVQASLTAL